MIDSIDSLGKTKYYETVFCRDEQIIIDKLREKGYFVYGLRDGEGDHYTVEPRVIINNIGFVVTDRPIQFHEESSRQYITDTELREIGDEESEISKKIDAIRQDIRKVKDGNDD